ncbi:E3 ubiquitin-protein ligase mib1-like [Patiria miniata]|uniref:RING-type E3 ubiquitin transferase n=1 Tax=Patiria miniata TaxID=46514 RepID=A0A914ABX8_PATMI|nr:E3 ubiquitin-protein ligase mib1-like [Patiria miniata]
MDEQQPQISPEIQDLVAKTAQYKAELTSIQVDDPRIDGTVAVREPHSVLPNVVVSVQYNIANCPIIGRDLRGDTINYYNPPQYRALEGTGPKALGQDQLRELNDIEPESDGQDTHQISVKQDLEPLEDGREIGNTTVKELAETGRDVHDKEKLTDKQEKGDWWFIGMRVVRGPDWQGGNEDGGCGCVGTVVPVQDVESKSRIWVRWDSGVLAEYRSGREGGQFDLRIYDNAQRGVKHELVDCDGCSERGVVGIRWKCLQCDDYDLCHRCYNECRHDQRHPFMRIDEPGDEPGVEVPCRLGAKRFTAFGIFAGAKVVRGPDWKWQAHEGAIGSVGTVTEIEKHETADSSRTSYRSLVKVQWAAGNSNYYRRGFEGQMDLQYFKKASNGEFFIEHLPTLDATTCSSLFEIGDKVRLRDIDLTQLKDIQEEHYGWVEKIKNASPCVKNGNLLIQSAIVGDDSEVKEILTNHPDVANYQNQQGVTALHLAAHHGHLDVVHALVEGNAPLEQQDTYGDTALMFAAVGNKPDVVQYLLLVGSNPNTSEERGLTPLHAAAGQANDKCVQALLSSQVQKCDVNSQDINGDTPLLIAIGRPGDNKAMLGLLIEHTTDDGLRLLNHIGFNSLHYAAYHGKKYAVEKILKRLPSMINIAKRDGFTALHLAATNGYTEIVKTLLKQENCDISARTVLKRQTARDLAVEASHQECINILDAHGSLQK